MTIQPESSAGMGSVGRGLPGTDRGERRWRQGLMHPPQLIHVRLDLGWDTSARIGMFAGEVYIPTSRDLIALEVHPARKYANIHAFLGHALGWQGDLVVDVFDPDPFG